MKKISIVIPVMDEQDNVTELYNQLESVLSKTGEYEILFIDDGSRDETAKRIKEIKDKNVRVIQFQRNFGKAAALSCGFKESKGDMIITMDGDLQDDPKEIPRFIEKLKDYDVVSGWKFKRYDPITKTIPSKFFNWLTKQITGVNIHDSNCGFKAYRRYVVENLDIYGELHRYIPALAHRKGYSIGEIKVEHHARKHGKSKYGVGRLLKGFLDLITVEFLINYTKRPLHFFGSIGIISGGFGFLICLYLVNLWIQSVRIGDRPLLMLGILLIIMGVQFIAIGLMGELMVSLNKTDNYVTKPP
jgi:glycosyltransferase involved in cell wall biosynthesis